VATLSTRKQIRRRVGRLTGDMILLVATSAGTTTTLIDALNLNQETNSLINRLGYVSGGTALNLNKTARVSGNTKSTQTLTFTPALTSATAALDEMELWNERDEGITPKDVNDLINDAILDAGEQGVVPVLGTEAAFARDSPIISVNAAWEAVTGVDWEDDAGIWHPIPRADLRFDRIQRQVEILNWSRELADAHMVRVRGANVPGALTADTGTGSETSVDFEWITHHVAAQAMGLRLAKAFDTKMVEGLMLKLEAKANQLRPKNTIRLRGAYWRLG
jgi:hypothetical protein